MPCASIIIGNNWNNYRTTTLECCGRSSLDPVGQKAAAIALGATGELQRGRCYVSFPDGRGILSACPSGKSRIILRKIDYGSAGSVVRRLVCF